MINEPVDVLIVGAGASGAAIAYSLSSLGVKILCLLFLSSVALTLT